MKGCEAPKCTNPIIGLTLKARFCSDRCRVRAAYYRKRVETVV